MKVFKIEDVKEFMQLLFLKENFDKFCLGGMELKTLVSFAIKGNLCTDWLDGVDKEKYGHMEYVPWKLLRPVAFSMIRGKQSPSMMRINFVHYMEDGGCGGLRVQYENGQLACISSYTAAHFSLDKSEEQLWDENCKRFLQKNNIVVSEVE